MKNLLPVIRRQKHKNKRAHATDARTHVITTLNVIGWFNYNFECDWPIELSDNKLSNNKLSDNNLASELVENRSVFKPITIEGIVIFMIKADKPRGMLVEYEKNL